MWQEPLYNRLRGNPYPLWSFASGVVPAASIWSGARLWTKFFRNAGMVSGDRLALSLEPSPALVQVLVAALWENLSLVMAPPAKNAASLAALLEDADARAAVWEGDGENAPGIFRPAGCEGPHGAPSSLRSTRHPPTPDARFLLQTSGTTRGGQGRWIALSDENVWSVLHSHTSPLALQPETRVLSVLPWHHAFGLFVDLLPALLAGCEIIRDPHHGKNTRALLALGQTEQAGYLCAVPLLLHRLRQEKGGEAFLQSLDGGVVGGAPVDADMASFLRKTRLRTGYGQTEASPGIALGEPGQWPGANFLGQAVGCEIRINVQGVLEYRGKNAHMGTWSSENGLVRSFQPNGWNSSGDLVTQTTQGLFYRGRSDDTFKMASGRRIEAGKCEADLMEACPPIMNALLHSPDGYRLVWYLHLAPGAAFHVLPLESALGNLSPLLSTAYNVPAETWVRTAKGAINRRETLARLTSFGCDGLQPAAVATAHPVYIAC